jgi:hypothetical protein
MVRFVAVALGVAIESDRGRCQPVCKATRRRALRFSNLWEEGGIPSLSKAEIEVSGEWGGARIQDVHAVVSSARDAITEGVKISAAGPTCIRVRGVPKRKCPIVLAHDAPDGSATMLLTVEGLRWDQIAYQFGHEFGHILANSWTSTALPRPPSHWLEEAIVEALTLYGLFQLTSRWLRRPPYPNWTRYAINLKRYAENRLTTLRAHENFQAFSDSSPTWFAAGRPSLEAAVALDEEIWPIIPWLTGQLRSNKALIADINALNRWPERGTIPIERYLDEWAIACRGIGAPNGLPKAVRERLKGTGRHR